MQPRNPYLYRRLKYVFGRVKVSNPGMPGTRQLVRRGNRTVVKYSGGEEYHVCCPFCGDRRFRLYLNHMYGTVNEYGVNDHAAICFNEDCLSSPENRRRLFEMVINREIPEDIVSHDIETEITTVDVELPECTSLLEALGGENPEPAVRALRFVNETSLDLSSVLENYEILIGREGQLIAPVRGRDGSLVAYQEIFYWKEKRDRYRTTGRKSLGFYRPGEIRNLIILVEGVKDAWALGADAWAILGSSLSQEQTNLLVDACSGGSRTVCVFLDADAEEKAATIMDTLSDAGIPCFRINPGKGDPADVVRAIKEGR